MENFARAWRYQLNATAISWTQVNQTELAVDTFDSRGALPVDFPSEQRQVEGETPIYIGRPRTGDEDIHQSPPARFTSTRIQRRRDDLLRRDVINKTATSRREAPQSGASSPRTSAVCYSQLS